MKVLLGYIPCRDREEAEKIATALLKARLAGCCNIVPGIRSLYWWEGKITHEQESLLLVKTREGNQQAITEMVTRLHSYEVPCIEFIAVDETNQAYAGWLAQELNKK